jgi:hypothetical protein
MFEPETWFSSIYDHGNQVQITNITVSGNGDGAGCNKP